MFVCHGWREEKKLIQRDVNALDIVKVKWMWYRLQWNPLEHFRIYAFLDIIRHCSVLTFLLAVLIDNFAIKSRRLYTICHLVYYQLHIICAAFLASFRLEFILFTFFSFSSISATNFFFFVRDHFSFPQFLFAHSFSGSLHCNLQTKHCWLKIVSKQWKRIKQKHR